MVTINPVAVAQFFHILCVTIIDHLLASSRQNGYLGAISYHYGIVETNTHSILHLHTDIKTQLLEDEL